MQQYIQGILIIALCFLCYNLGKSSGRGEGVRDFKDKIRQILEEKGYNTEEVHDFFRDIYNKFNEDRHKL